MKLSAPEQAALRRYLLNGGFLMMDDFWASRAWAQVSSEMRGVFPDREPRELSLSHPIFHFVYDLKEFPQVVDIRTWREGENRDYFHRFSEKYSYPMGINIVTYAMTH